jgi:hypothetical protein
VDTKTASALLLGGALLTSSSMMYGNFNAYAATTAVQQKAATSAFRLTAEIQTHYGAKSIRKFNSIKSRRQMIDFLKGLKKSKTAQILVQNVKAVGPNPGGGGGTTHIDPIDLGCLNCLGVHCPTSSSDSLSN